MPVPASTNQHGVINSNRSISVAAIVPGSIPLSLFAAKVWPDPYYGFDQGALNCSMALETNWSYTRTFDFAGGAGERATTELVARQLATDGGHRQAERRRHRRVSRLNARAVLTRLEATDCHALRELLVYSANNPAAMRPTRH